MRVLHRSTQASVWADVILGVGLVGEAVAQAIRVLPGSVLLSDLTLATDWGGALEASLDAAGVRVNGLSPSVTGVRVFWCAGRAGFGSPTEQCDVEQKALEVVVRWAERLSHSHHVEFHLTSSAGGLHEGQLLVTKSSPLRTHRPYCALKLAQEEALQASSLRARFVYRLSSVYGLPVSGRRLGLISALVVNALRQRPTLITAHASTLRDFVSSADVARFMALEDKPAIAVGAGVYYLVSGCPLSVWSLHLAVERRLLRRVSVVYSTGKDNFESTTFLPSIRPRRWVADSVESNLTRIVGAAQTFAR